MIKKKMEAEQFNGDRLRLARLLHGYTQAQLGDCASVTRQYVHQLESGSKHPADDVLLALCEALQVEEAFFYAPTGNEVKAEQCHFRKRRTTPVGLTNRVVAYSTIFERLVAWLHSHLDLPPVNFIESASSGDNYTNEEIERAAEDCRKHWHLGLDNPISSMTRVLENAGVVITHFDGVSDKVDALSLKRKYPIIIRNIAKESVCRMRFDLAHECGHFVLHEGLETGEPVTEKEADKFASAFLFPRMAFLKEFPDLTRQRNLDWKKIYGLKLRWGMSARAIIYRAHFLGKITAQQYRSANVWLNRSGQSKTEKYDEAITPETPEILFTAFELLSETLGISFNAVAKELAVSADVLSQITGIIPSEEGHLENITPFRHSIG